MINLQKLNTLIPHIVKKRVDSSCNLKRSLLYY